MSRQRRYISNCDRKLRNEVPMFQASETEILSDLKKMKYVKKIETEPVVTKIELPKKRKPSNDEDKSVVDALIKLMTTKVSEIKEKQPNSPEKKTENTAKAYPNPTWLSLLALQSHLMKNMYSMNTFNYFNQQPLLSVSSSADKHVRAARFIQSCKLSRKHEIQK